MSRWDMRALAFPAPELATALIGFSGVVFQHPQWLLDLIRAVVLAEASLVILVALLIARRYYVNYTVAPDTARLLPRHVTRLGLGVVLLTISAMAVLVERVEVAAPFDWAGAPILLPAMTTLVCGLFDMVRWMPHRHAAHEFLHREREDRHGSP